MPHTQTLYQNGEKDTRSSQTFLLLFGLRGVGLIAVHLIPDGDWTDEREGEGGGDVGTLMRKRREHANSGGKNWSGRTRTALRQSRLPPSLMLLGEVACKGGQGRPIPQFNLSISPLPSIFIFSFKLRTEMENNPLHFCSTRNCMIHYFSV